MNDLILFLIGALVGGYVWDWYCVFQMANMTDEKFEYQLEGIKKIRKEFAEIRARFNRIKF